MLYSLRQEAASVAFLSLLCGEGFDHLGSTSSFVGLDPWGLDPGAWKKPKLSKSEVNLKKVEKIHEKSKPVCEQSNR